MMFNDDLYIIILSERFLHFVLLMNSSSSGTTSTSLVSPSGSLSPLPQPSSSEARARSIKESIEIEAKQALASMKDGTDTSCLHPVCNDDDV